MSELSGTLEGVGLPALVHFLNGVKKTGCLRITHDQLPGDVFFEAGRLSGASLGSRRGLTALDALVETMALGSFTFESDALESGGPSIDLTQEALNVHLDELTSRALNGTQLLPSFEAVPSLVQLAGQPTEEPLAVDRGALQTLLAVDGQRTVREVVAQRGTFDALWQLADLARLGLVALPARVPAESRSRTFAPPPAAASQSASAPVASQPLSVAAEPQSAPAEPAAPAEPPSRIDSLPSPERPLPLKPAAQLTPPTRRPISAQVAGAEPTNHCQKLGFEDDPSNSFSRPTRLHRCFAGGTPLPLSLDQQRELCLSDQFGTCPRLTLNVTDDPRVVRLPFVARAASERAAVSDHQAVGGRQEPTRFRPSAAPARDAARATPTPLRARAERSNVVVPASPISASPSPSAPPVVAATPPPVPAEKKPASAEQESVARGLAGGDASPRAFGVPIRLLAVGAVAVVVIGVVAYLGLQLMGDLSFDDTINATTLPNSAAVANGGAVPQLTPRPRGTAVTRPTASSSAADAVAPLTTDDPLAPPTGAEGANAATAALQPTLAPQPQQQSQVTPNDPLAGSVRLNEQFSTDPGTWPTSPDGTADWANGAYRLMTRQAGQFVAIGAPLPDALQDVVVSATFHKASGPSGGGYGIILRDQASPPQNGTSQDGRYYVLEVGDKGEVGMWRRDGDHWLDLLPWQRSAAVKTGTAVNEVTAQASGSRLSLSVNGTLVATRTDATYTSGGVGLFTGGDGNVVAVDKFSVSTP